MIRCAPHTYLGTRTMPKIKVLGGSNTPEFQAEDHTVTIDAAAVAQAISDVVAEHTGQAIAKGKKPSGPPQAALGEAQAKRAKRGKRNPQRGMGSQGRFAKDIDSKKARGVYRATGTVTVDSFFDKWLKKEAKRGVEYLETEGQVDKIVEEAIERMLDAQGFG